MIIPKTVCEVTTSGGGGSTGGIVATDITEYVKAEPFIGTGSMQLVYDSSADLNLQNKIIINSSFLIINPHPDSVLTYRIYRDELAGTIIGFPLIIYEGSLFGGSATLINLENLTGFKFGANGSGYYEYRAVIKPA